MLETMNEDYIRTARAKGLPERTVVVKHGLRAALTPILTIFGLDLGLLLGGAVLTETHVLAARHRQVRRRRDRQQRPAEGARRDAARPRSSSSSPTWSSTSCTPSIDPRVRVRRVTSREAPRAPRTCSARPAPRTSAFLDVRDLRVHFPTDDGLVKSVDGLSFHARAGQDPRHRRGVRLRQERDQPGDHGPAQAGQRPRSPARSGSTARSSSSADARDACASCAARRWR